MTLEVADGADEKEELPEVRLWLAVLASTVEEWVNGPLRMSREAEAYLFEDKEDFRLVCESANVNPERLRETLWRCKKRAEFARESLRSRN